MVVSVGELVYRPRPLRWLAIPVLTMLSISLCPIARMAIKQSIVSPYIWGTQRAGGERSQHFGA